MYYYKIKGLLVTSATELQLDGNYKAGEVQTLTEQEYNDLLNPAPIEPSEFELKKAIKQDAFNAYAYMFIYNGYEDVETGYKLFTAKEDIEKYALIAGSISMLKESELPTFEMEFGTYTGWQVETALVLKDILNRYTKYVYPISTKLLKTQGEIDRATTVEEIEAIVIL